MSSFTEVTKLHLAHTKGGFLTVTHVEKPHGEHSSPLLQIGVSLTGEKVDTMVEVPYENLADLIQALHDSNKVCNTFVHEQFHSELGANTGGGE